MITLDLTKGYRDTSMYIDKLFKKANMGYSQVYMK